MIMRDATIPSVILWGARINESDDDHVFIRKLTRSPTPDYRQTAGVRWKPHSEFLEDVCY